MSYPLTSASTRLVSVILMFFFVLSANSAQAQGWFTVAELPVVRQTENSNINNKRLGASHAALLEWQGTTYVTDGTITGTLPVSYPIFADDRVVGGGAANSWLYRNDSLVSIDLYNGTVTAINLASLVDIYFPNSLSVT